MPSGSPRSETLPANSSLKANEFQHLECVHRQISSSCKGFTIFFGFFAFACPHIALSIRFNFPEKDQRSDDDDDDDDNDTLVNTPFEFVP